MSASLSERENYLRTITFGGPQWIPCRVSILNASWDQLRGELERVVARHPTLFPGFRPGERDYDRFDFGPGHTAGVPFRDAWGCVWLTNISGLEGQVIEHPLEDWGALDTYQVPDPLQTGDRGPVDWEAARRHVERRRAAGLLTTGGVPHGFLYMRLAYLRGFESFMLDVATDDPHLPRLIEMIHWHNARLVQQWLDIGVDMVTFGEDLGSQKASVLSPAQFRRYIAPSYARLMQPCRQAGSHVLLHSDGYIMELMDDLIACGVDIINPQDRCNGVDNLAREVKGRICIRLDVDRQSIVPFGTRQEIRELIEYEIRTLGSPQGGLEMLSEIDPPTPPENVDAVCEAFEELRTYWWDGPRRRVFATP